MVTRYKSCTGCRLTKVLACFEEMKYRRKPGRVYRKAACFQCEALRKRESFRANWPTRREHRLELVRGWKRANPGAVSAWNRAYYQRMTAARQEEMHG